MSGPTLKLVRPFEPVSDWWQSKTLAEQAGERVSDYVAELHARREALDTVKPKELAAGRAILEADLELQAHAAAVALEQLCQYTTQHFQATDGMCYFVEADGLRSLIVALLRKKLPFGERMVLKMAYDIVLGRPRANWSFPGLGIVRHIETYLEQDPGNEEVLEAVRAWHGIYEPRWLEADDRRIYQRLEGILDGTRPDTPLLDLDTGEAWTRQLNELLATLSATDSAAWQHLLIHCLSARASKPSGRWLKIAADFLEKIGPATFAAGAGEVFRQIGRPGAPVTFMSTVRMESDETLIHDKHSNVLRGLLWAASQVEDGELISALGDAAVQCFKKVAGFGPRSTKIGNACLFALAHIGSIEAVGQLARLKPRIKHVSARKQLAKALDAAAARLGLASQDLEELAVPTLGLQQVGRQHMRLGDVTAVLSVNDRLKAELTWIKADGKTQKSVPAAIKEAHAARIKALKKTARDIDAFLQSQRARVEQLYLQEKSWTYRDFQKRYLDHPLVGVVARRLIWEFGPSDAGRGGIWQDGAWLDARGQLLEPPAADTAVRLWHPMNQDPQEVLEFRQLLQERLIRQPFKQAHREIYLLTDAERETVTYSNRFAAHVLRQHQFSALCQERGWAYRLIGAWDSHNTPCLELPGQDIRVEFWVDGLGEYPDDTTESAIYLHLATDQVRFCRGDDLGALPLQEVPPLVFSEAMRDVDLFVGVCSVGNDPQWADGGPQGRDLEYWRAYAFGDLSHSAVSRREVLAGLLPGLAIAGRCELADRFLVVRGQLREYRIHLGSGNVMMSPNDEYLCIVQSRRGAGKGRNLFLPFEGDHTLTMILSKAFLLVDDDAIEDPGIRGQIRRGSGLSP